MEPLISVLIPTYNRPVLLLRAVKSVLSQTYNHIEIVISDNSDNNLTIEALKEINFENRKFIYNKNKENIGPILNWKKSLQISNGEYCIILPDDDFLINPFYFEDAIDVLKKNKVRLLFTACILGHEKVKSTVAGIDSSAFIDGNKFICGFWESYQIPTFANIFNRNLTNEVDLFYDNDILYSDIEFWLKSLAITNVYFYNIPSVYYSFHDNNIVKNMNIEVLVKNSKFISSVIEFYKQKEISINYDLIKSSLLTRYIIFTNSIYSFYSYKYVKKIIEINNYRFYDLKFRDIYNLLTKCIIGIIRKKLL